METQCFINKRFNDLIFENKNKKYGAYAIRTTYDNRLITAFILSILFLLTLMGALFLSNDFKIQTTDAASIIYSTDLTNITDEVKLPPAEKKTPPQHPANKTKPNTVEAPVKPPSPTANYVVVDEIPENRPDSIVHDIPLNPVVQEPSAATDPGVPGTSTIPMEIPLSTTENTVVYRADQMPEFIGGQEKLIRYLQRHISYPEEAVKQNITGTVYISFIIDKEGNVSEVKPLNTIAGGCNEEALRVVKAMPRWKPGYVNGKPVRVALTLPVGFKLNH